MTAGPAPPTAIFLSVHKAASTFLAAELAPVLCRALRGVRHLRVGWLHLRGTPLSEMTLPATGVIATRVYPDLYDRLIEDPVPPGGRFAGKRLIMVRRDPRDAAVSMYYSKAYSHRPPPGQEQPFLEERRRLLAMSPADGIREMTAAVAIEEFLATESFFRRFPATCAAPYEQLVGDFDAWYAAVCRHLELPPEVAERAGAGLAAAVTPPPDEDPARHKRRVTPGNWREVFDEGLCALFEQSLGGALTRAGYEW